MLHEYLEAKTTTRESVFETRPVWPARQGRKGPLAEAGRGQRLLSASVWRWGWLAEADSAEV